MEIFTGTINVDVRGLFSEHLDSLLTLRLPSQFGRQLTPSMRLADDTLSGFYTSELLTQDPPCGAPWDVT